MREAYRIPGITEGECRSIFLDWALSLPAGADPALSARVLLERYGTPGHPMTAVLEAALTPPDGARRRGGRNARIRPAKP